jgi:hypothetical protein
MGFKTGLIFGLGVGYVLGARAGRTRYEELRQAWQGFIGNPKVQQAVEKSKEVAHAGAERGIHAFESGVQKAATSVKERLGDGEEPG